jgi:16S rRNA (guanine966-N2)-methyltransferase
MRVISGSAKGRRLRAVPGEETRPITDRVKEALFDIIGADVLDSTWWDVFAGTGAVGIEALSRGAAHARFTELHRGPLQTIRANLDLTGLAGRADVRQADALRLMSTTPDRSFDYIYVAPPQYHELWSASLRALDANEAWLDVDGWIVAQVHPKEYSPLPLLHLEPFETRRYGTTLLAFLMRKQA